MRTNNKKKLYDSELRVMNVIWREGDLTAKQVSDILAEEVGWHINTTYTLLKRCIQKGALERRDPKFVCHALRSRDEVRTAELDELIEKLYDGDKNSFLEDMKRRIKG